MKKSWAIGRIPTWSVQDGFSISAFEDLYLWYIATEHERTWKQNERKWMQNEKRWKKMKKKQMTCVDSRPRMLSHPQKARTFTLLVYRELTTWENDKSKNNDNIILGNLKRYGVLIQPHVLYWMAIWGYPHYFQTKPCAWMLVKQ